VSAPSSSGGSRFTFEPDEAGIRKVLEGPGVADTLTAAAVQMRERIQRYAPRGFIGYWRSARYVPARQGPDGLEAAAGNDSPVWHLPEYGTVNYPARAPIRKAAREVLAEFKEGSP
jgi:hypothetical protein